MISGPARKICFRVCAAIFLLTLLFTPAHSRENRENANLQDSASEYRIRDAYREALGLDWHMVLKDRGKGDWKKFWFLDGTKARILNTGKGMEFFAGPVPAEDASHSVLWTKKDFHGDIRVEYEYTRLDSSTRYVNIIYLLASGSGAAGYPVNIREWSGKRSVPAMKIYYNHMNLLHISYAAFNNDNNERGNDYIRARRYLPETEKGLQGTGLVPDYFRTGFFRPGETCRITVIRHGNDLFMHIREGMEEKICHWDISGFPPLAEGRIGLRQMGSRAARYRNFKVYELR